MFQVNVKEERRDSFWYTAEIKKPADTDDGYVIHTIDFHFLELRQSEINKIYTDSQTGRTKHKPADQRLLDKVVIDWKEGDVADEDRVPLPCDKKHKDLLFDIPYLRRQAAQQYVMVIQGQDFRGRKTKNSEEPVSTGTED